jgi:hypothetical protein
LSVARHTQQHELGIHAPKGRPTRVPISLEIVTKSPSVRLRSPISILLLRHLLGRDHSVRRSLHRRGLYLLAGGNSTIVDAKPTASSPMVHNRKPPLFVLNCRACLSLGPASKAGRRRVQDRGGRIGEALPRQEMTVSRPRRPQTGKRSCRLVNQYPVRRWSLWNKVSARQTVAKENLGRPAAFA